MLKNGWCGEIDLGKLPRSSVPSECLTLQGLPLHAEIGCSTHRPIRLRKNRECAWPSNVNETRPVASPLIRPCQTKLISAWRQIASKLNWKESGWMSVRSLEMIGRTVPQF